MKYLILLLWISMSGSLLHASSNTGCQFVVEKGICANLNFTDGISRKNDSSFSIEFLGPDKKALTLKKTPEIKLWMVMKSGHGHGSEKLEIQKIDQKYMVKNVWFLMMGEWQIKTKFIYGDRVVLATIPVCVGRNSKLSKLGKCQ